MGSIYKCEVDPEDKEVLESLQEKISKIAGVTLTGNRLTIRWHLDEQLVQAHMIIENVITPKESLAAIKSSRRMSKAFKKDKTLADDLFYIEHGSHCQ